MSEIIKINKTKIGTIEVNSVDARELHSSLGIKKDFSAWIKPKLSDGMLEENVDFIVFSLRGENLSGGRPSLEYILTLDTAKHIAMLSRSEKAKEIRSYFIEMEKLAIEKLTNTQTTTSNEVILLEMVKNMQIQIANQQSQTDIILELIKERRVAVPVTTNDVTAPWQDEDEHYNNLIYEKYLDEYTFYDLVQKYEIMRIKNTSPMKIAKVLKCTKSQATKYKSGYTELKNSKALKLEKELGLLPTAFNEIHVVYGEMLQKRIENANSQ